MRTHWPLGRGDYARSLVHARYAAMVGLVPLFITAIHHASDPLAWAAAAACRFWVLAMFVALALELPVLRLFRAAVIRGWLATPADEADMYESLDPARHAYVRVLPYALGVLVMLPQWSVVSNLRLVAGMVFACALFRLLVPVLGCLAMRARKLLVPWGHLIVWVAAVGTLVGLWRGFPTALERTPSPPLVLDAALASVWLALAALLVVLARPVRQWCRRDAIRHFRRDELVDYAFPILVERRHRPRKLLVETLGDRQQQQRFLFLVQEATGLYRAVDWAKTALLWAVSLVVLLLFAGLGSGSRAHSALTIVPLAVVFVWCMLRHFDYTRGCLGKPLAAYALPVGHAALFWTRAIVFTAAYVTTGALIWLGLAATAGDDAPPLLVRLGAGAVNLAQLWLLVVGSAAALSGGATSARRKATSLLADYAIFMAFYFLLLAFFVGAQLGPITADLSPRAPRQHHLAAAFFSTCQIIWVRTAPVDASTPNLAWEQPGHLVPPWACELAGWLIPALLFAWCVRMLRRRARGRAHPSYADAIFPTETGVFASLLIFLSGAAARRNQPGQM